MMENQIAVDKLVKVYLKMKLTKEQVDAEYKNKNDEITNQMNTVKQALLEYCKEQQVESVRTSEGSFYRTVKKRFWTNDWDAMGKFVLEHKIPELFEKRLHQGNTAAFLEENRD
jgi:hydroxymethylglutaryl-CoA reductase